MDHMRNSGTEATSVILTQTQFFVKLKSDTSKVPKQAKVKTGWCNLPTKLQFQSILIRKIYMLSHLL